MELINDFKLYIEMAKIGNYSHVSRREKISESSLYRKMKRFEKQTGKVLFRYKNKRIVLTNEGKSFLLFAEKVVSEYETLFPVAVSSKLYIGFSYEQYPKFFNSLVSRLQEAFSINLIKCIGSDFQKYFDNNEIDIFFSFYDWFDEYGSIFYQKLFDIPLSILCCKKCELFYNEKITIDDLKRIKNYIVYLKKKNSTLIDYQRNHPDVNFKIISDINEDNYSFITDSNACFIFPNIFNYCIERTDFRVIPVEGITASYGYFYRNSDVFNNDKIMELLSSIMLDDFFQ